MILVGKERFVKIDFENEKFGFIEIKPNDSDLEKLIENEKSVLCFDDNCKIKEIKLSELSTFNYKKYKSYDLYKFNDNTGLALIKDYEVLVIKPDKIEDLDLIVGIFNEDISPIIAEAIRIGRDIYEENGYFRKDILGLNLDKSPCYKHYRIPKKEKGKFRDIYEPEEKLKQTMKIINFKLEKYFLTKQEKRHTNQFAYIKERNIKYNANIHRNNKTIVKVDVSKFFDNLKFDYIKKYLNFLCKDELLLNEFKKLIVNPETGGLYMGNPISGTLGNLLFYKVAISLENIFNSKGMDVSIYSDDITVSARDGVKISKEMVVNIINYVFNFYGLKEIKLKEGKTKKLSNNNRRICGVSINHNNQLTVKRSEYEKLRVMLYKLSKNEKIDIPVSELKGKINFYLYIDETEKFKRLLDKYKDLEIFK